MRKIQETLAKQKEYAEAHKMKLKADSVVPPPRTHAALHTCARTLVRAMACPRPDSHTRAEPPVHPAPTPCPSAPHDRAPQDIARAYTHHPLTRSPTTRAHAP